MRAILLVPCLLAAATATAHADRDLCAPAVKHHGAILTLDFKDADIRDVMRLIADAAHVNLVVADSVNAKVTAKLVKVPWDSAVCAIAATSQLRVGVEDNILTVTPRSASAAQR